jgi:AraC-like DNA-binding protein
VGAVTRRVLVATDTESTLALLSGLRGEVWVRIRGGGGGMRVDQVGIGPVTLDQGSFDTDLDIDVGPVGKLVFGQVSGGAVGYRTGGAEHWHSNDGAYLAGQPGHGRTSMFRGGVHEQAVIDPALPGQIAATEPGRTERPVRFTGYAAISAAAARTWRHTYAYARDIVDDLPDTAAHPLLVSNVARMLVATALTSFPNNALTDPTIEDRHDAHLATLRRAVAFIDDNAHCDITIAEIAEAAHVTIRAVQHAFKRHMGTTPTAYLRRVRLDHAHQELAAADPAQQTVTAIAYRWGFPSPSRFAGYYRDIYGVRPGHTLRN